MKSIMHKKDERTCFLCMVLCEDYSEKMVLEEHHIFGGTSNRKNSEREGLKVYLCPPHHRTGTMAAHRNKDIADILHQAGQLTFEKTHTREEFMKIFGRSYV